MYTEGPRPFLFAIHPRGPQLVKRVEQIYNVVHLLLFTPQRLAKLNDGDITDGVQSPMHVQHGASSQPRSYKEQVQRSGEDKCPGYLCCLCTEGAMKTGAL